MLSTLRLFIVAALLYVPADIAAQTNTKPQKVCAGKTNQLVVRSRCKKGEKVITRAAIEQKLNETVDSIFASAGGVGPVGPTGETGPVGLKGATGNAGAKGAKGLIDFSACRKVTQSEDNVDGSVEKVSIEVSCAKDFEFIFDDQYQINIFGNSAGTKVVVQSRSPDSATGDNRDYFVEYTLNRITLGGSGLYSVNLLALCCPL